MEVLARIAKATVAALVIGVYAHADQIASQEFHYLNNNEAPPIIGASEAQDLLNVDITAGGLSVKKREGYGLYRSVGGSAAMHGGHHFFDTSGNDVQVWGSNTSLYGSVGDSAFVQLVSSATSGSTWDCADSQGFAYCVNSARNALIRTNGATISWYTAPLGTMVAITPDRLLIAGVSGAANSIYFSESTNFTNFVVGNSPISPFVEVIAGPGSRLTHIEYACGRILWWKDQSFGYILGSDQVNLQVVTVSNLIGTIDNSSTMDPNGNVYFRGQEGHLYRYDCSGLEKLSVDISPNIQASGQRTSNSYSESTQSEFQGGTIVPTGSLSTTISPNEITPSSFTAIDTASADFAQGSFNNTYRTATGVIISTNNTTYSSSWGENGTWGFGFSNPYTNCGTMTDKGGDGFVLTHNEGADWTVTAEVVETNGGAVIATVSIPYTANTCAWTQRTLTIGAAHARKRAFVRFKCSANPTGHNHFTNDILLSGADITFWTASDIKASARTIFIDGAGSTAKIDNGISTITSGSFTSRPFDTGLYRSYASIAYNATVNDFTPTFAIQDAASTSGPWTEIGTAANTSYSTRRFVRYSSSFSVDGVNDASTSLDDVTFLARSSGTYYSPVINRANLAAWDSITATVVNNGGGHTFYMRSSASTFNPLATSPAWTAQTAGSLITIPTGVYFQFRDDFLVDASNDTPTLSDYTLNWFEGTASDKAYAQYFNDAVWWSVAFGDGVTTNNYIFKYDLLHPGWTLYNFGANGFVTQGNRLYFGSTTNNSVFRYGSSTSDNGAAINSYWQSKDFPGVDPWLENEYTQIDTLFRRNPGQTMTVSYALNGSSTTTSFPVSLSNSTESNIRWKKLLPAGKLGGLFSIKFSEDSSTSAWELLGYRIVFKALPYRPSQ